jgi:hypothetical protein
LVYANRIIGAASLGRADVAWQFVYDAEPYAWVTDVGGGNPERFLRGDLRVRIGERLDVELLIEGDTLDTEPGTRWPSIGDMPTEGSDPFPAPVAVFRAGRVWLRDAVRAWQARNLRLGKAG